MANEGLTSGVEARLRSRLPNHAIGDPDFRTLLDVASDAIRRAAKRAMNEATIEAAFERHLFNVLQTVGVNYEPTKEAYVAGTRLRVTGRTDSRFRNVVIEFKHRSEMTTPALVRKHTKQINDYLQALIEDGGEQIGFLTDGLKIVRSVCSHDGNVHVGAVEDIDQASLLVLCQDLLASKSSALRADNLVNDFCGLDFSGHLFDAAKALFKCIIRHASIKTEMLRTEWEALFRLAHEDTTQQKRIQMRTAALAELFSHKIDHNAIEYLSIFSLHTAYSIVVKLMSFKVVSDSIFGMALTDFKSLTTASDDTLQAFMATLEDGDLFRQVGILNLLEGDFFSWYSDKNQWNAEIAACVRNILRVLARYEDAKSIFAASTAVDLFRHLYEAAIPQIVRSSFGEFYTPLWLAEHVLNASGFSPGARVLDPCCGSGTFLITALQTIRTARGDLSRDQTLALMLDSVVGIDLNPLAVLTARVHYFIYISDLVEVGSEILIPVFLGDSSDVPLKLKDSAGEEFYKFQIRTIKTPLDISIPAKVAKDAAGLFRLMNAFEVRLARSDYKGARSIIEDYAGEIRLSKNDRSRLLHVADQITDLERKQWNGIWARIVANFVSTVAIGTFDHVIGNPPWIDWKSLPEGYRETIKQLCIDKGLFSGARRTGGINLNVCALIAHVAATNWLAKRGTLAFLMPRELAVQPSYEGWRQTVGGASCRLVEFHDWSKAGHPFEPVREDFMTYILERGGTPGDQVACTAFVKKKDKSKAWLWSNWNEAQTHLDEYKQFAKALHPMSTAFTFADEVNELDEFAHIAGPCEYLGREGIEFYPQELLMFRYKDKGRIKGTVWVDNFQGNKSKFKIPLQTILLETKYLFPLVKGPFISPFEYEENDLLVAFPYKSADPHYPVDRTILQNESRLLLDYMLKYEKEMSAQTAYSDALRAKGGEFYGVARTGPYSFAHHYVAFRDNTKWSACVINDKLMPWGERKRYLFQNHAVSMCEDAKRKTFITEEEAHYIVAIMNADVVRRYIHASSDERSFKIRPPIYLPKFRPANAIHRKLAGLSRLAHEDEEQRAAISLKASELYLDLCRKRLD